ncbi:MerR family transcriptional regulator [Catellatospora methionotrophica]|uniref:MerR family transcriptional regulator n=1 Tax=Catellatospora methionotrophica TaxID=121620 RepID=A0A8J3PFS3_9ACTN|nr:MerR family transcriptional regulator [Catellatospora methionotrophica]GIG15991.1 MerR family transcriptional regulator [Catellatospora methionotrophica]
MKISELSRHSGVSLPTVKYYLREGLLPAGRSTGRNQAEYDVTHLRRLRLIRALIDVGNLSVAGVRQVLLAVDDGELPGHHLLGTAHEAIAGVPRADRGGPAWQAAREEAARIVADRGWRVHEHAPALDQLADAIAALRELGQQDMLAMVDGYAEATERLAVQEVGLVLARGDRASMVEGLVTGTVLGEAVLTALRRLAQEHTSAGLTEPPG